jgi:hypothetical protein
VLEEPARGKYPPVEFGDSVLEPRQVDQVLDDAIQPNRLALERGEVPIARFAVERCIVRAKGFDVTAHRRQRRFQFVRDVGEHLAAKPIRGAQCFIAVRQISGHRVERRCHRGNLVAAGHWRARRKVARTEPLTGFLQRRQPTPRRTEDETGRDHRQDDHQRRPRQ